LEVSFFEKKAQDIETLLVKYYESMVGACAVGSPQRGFIKVIVYLLFTFGKYFDGQQKQNLLRYATDEHLDALGEFRGGNAGRLTDKKAVTTFQITIEESGSTVTINKGFKRAAIDGIIFETAEAVSFQPGETVKSVGGICSESGEVGNGYLPGQINKAVDINAQIVSMENTATSQGGAEREKNDPYRERLREMPEALSVAGPEGAYKSIAKSVSPKIIDVYVGSPSPGVVDIIPLLENGEIPDSGILNEVLAACDDKTVRPLTDNPQTSAPTTVTYNVDLDYYVSSLHSNDIDGTKAAIEAAVDKWVLWTRCKLGRDVNPDTLVENVRTLGGKRLVIREPAFAGIDDGKIAVLGNINVVYKGVEDEKDS